MIKKWKTVKLNNELAANLSEKYGFDPFFSLLLVARGYDTKEKIDSFLSDEIQLSDPFKITDMDKAVERINLALENGEKICVYGDYDADGITATTVVCQFLEGEGGNVVHSIPQRADGYGLNMDALHSLKEQGVSLIVTVDNGISAIDETDFAKEIGIDLVITDHHQVGEKIPNAVAVVDPHRDNLSFCEWAGVGVAFKLISALYHGDPQDLLDEYGDLVAIGTVADIVPLIGENRILVKAGLKTVNENQRPGLVAFRQVANMQDKVFTSMDLGFVVAPKINAAGRMGDAEIALKLLSEENVENALLLAQQLFEMNSARQGEEQRIFNKIMDKISNNPKIKSNRVVVVYGEGYNSGVIGIVASKMVDAFGKPAIVLTNSENGLAVGSCRSLGDFSIYDALSFCSEDLVKFGGHKQAAGLTLEIEKIQSFADHINEYAYSKFPVMPVSEISIDCPISPGYLTLELLGCIDQLGPFGLMNEQPLFAITGAELLKIVPVGEGKHLRLACKKGNLDFTAMLFGTSEINFPYNVGDKVDLAVKISHNIFRGVESVSIQAVDVRPSKFQCEKYVLEKELWVRFENGEIVSDENIESITPSREVSADIYRFLLKNKGYSKGAQGLYFSLNRQNISYGQMMIALTAFCQLGLVSIDGDAINLIAQSGKVDLGSAPILIDLKSRLDYGK